MNRAMLTILVMSIVIFCSCESEGPSVKSETGKTVPGFTLVNYDDTIIDLFDYKGKIVVLEWFNYECPFVKHHYEKAKTMTTLANKYKDRKAREKGLETFWICL